MRSYKLLPALIAIALASAACGSSEQSKTDSGSQSTSTVKGPSQVTAPAPVNDGPPVAVSHGGPGPATGPAGGPDTSALDKKIEQAEATAKASGATQADKLAAATAYLERGNVFYSAGTPALYKFALRDFRRALRYDPDNSDASKKKDEIVRIYKSLNRPVPDLGNEP